MTDEPLSPLTKIAWEFLSIFNAHTAAKKNEVPRKDKKNITSAYIRFLGLKASGTYTFFYYAKQ